MADEKRIFFGHLVKIGGFWHLARWARGFLGAFGQKWPKIGYFLVKMGLHFGKVPSPDDDPWGPQGEFWWSRARAEDSAGLRSSLDPPLLFFGMLFPKNPFWKKEHLGILLLTFFLGQKISKWDFEIFGLKWTEMLNFGFFQNWGENSDWKLPGAIFRPTIENIYYKNHAAGT